jgi:NAD+ synthase (glutamine-hydrolysing)
MKIALAQINTVVGALEGNVRRAREWIARAEGLGAELVVFPELTLSGYPPKDLVALPDFIEANARAIEDLARSVDGSAAALVGFVDRSEKASGKGIANAAALLAGGRVRARYHKWLLPTYDVFDEGRYFDPGETAEPMLWRGMRLGVTICEDMWNDAAFWEGRRLYGRDPVEAVVVAGVDCLVNLSASPFCLGKREARLDMLAATARRHEKPLVYVNLVAGNDSLIFDGASEVYDARGQRVAALADFEEDLLVFDTDAAGGESHDRSPEGIERVRRALCLGLRDYVDKCGFERVVVGLSGGIDSAMTAALAAEALGPKRVVGVSMPSVYSSRHSKDDAAHLAGNLGIEYRVISIEPMFDCFAENLAPQWPGRAPDVTEENLQARIRGMILMALSNKMGWLVLATGNKSELATGYCTLYGDMCGGLAPLADVPKTMVYDLAGAFNRDREIVPRGTVEKPPSAELRPGQKDSDTLPDYAVLDRVMRAYIEERKSPGEIADLGIDRAVVEDVLWRITHSEYKRQQAPIGLKVTSQAFGYGWRFPVARGEY